jgi:hypothetical protein
MARVVDRRLRVAVPRPCRRAASFHFLPSRHLRLAARRRRTAAATVESAAAARPGLPRRAARASRLRQLLLVYPSSMSAPACDDKARGGATSHVYGTGYEGRPQHYTRLCLCLVKTFWQHRSSRGCSCHIKAVGLDCYGCNKNYKKNGQFAVRTHARARTASDPCRHSPSRRPGAHGYRLCSHPASTVHLCLSLVQRSSSLAWLFGYKYSHPVALAPPPPLPFPCHSPPLA